MLNTREFCNRLTTHGFDLFCGVPCSFLASLMNVAINECSYISATNEGDAVATCAGAHLAGKKSVMLMQNSGLGNAVSPITSLLNTFHLPVLMMVSLRGAPDISDEPQHEMMGQITPDLLRLMGVQSAILGDDMATVDAQIQVASDCMNAGKPFAFIVKKGTFDKVSLRQSQGPVTHPKPLLNGQPSLQPIGTRTQALQRILAFNDCAILSTTGKTGRECFELNDSRNQFYQIGSMGCVSALAFGVAYGAPNVPVIAIDGDGAALMRLGSLATTGFYGPKNMCHIVLDNGVHDSTGGQKTAAEAVDFEALACALNYPNVVAVASLDELSNAVSDWIKTPGLTFIYVRISPGSPATLGRPTITPPRVAARFAAFLADANA
jgi:phosphonopyruvate decarboxylase